MSRFVLPISLAAVVSVVVVIVIVVAVVTTKFRCGKPSAVGVGQPLVAATLLFVGRKPEAPRKRYKRLLTLTHLEAN